MVIIMKIDLTISVEVEPMRFGEYFSKYSVDGDSPIDPRYYMKSDDPYLKRALEIYKEEKAIFNSKCKERGYTIKYPYMNIPAWVTKEQYRLLQNKD